MKRIQNRPNRGKYRRVARKWHYQKCVCCGTKQALTIHHIDGNPWNQTPRNLVFLCVDCHQDVDQKFDGIKIHQIKAYIRHFNFMIKKYSNNYKPFRF